jgi:glycosyltransferase involved in cell wall biosynthesis
LRILFLSSWFPSPPINGAKTRVNNMLRYLVGQHDITLISFVNTLQWEQVESELAHWRRVCRRVIAMPRPRQKRTKSILGYFSPLPRHLAASYDGQVMETIRNEVDTNDFDLILASEVGPAAGMAYYASRLDDCPKIVDCIEVAQLRDNILATSRRVRLRAHLTWFKFKPFMQDLQRRFDLCTVPSHVEESLIREIAGRDAQILVLPHSLDLDYLSFGSEEREPDTLVYNGSMTYQPNRDAVWFFSQEIMPEIVKSVPQIRLRVLGDACGMDSSLYARPELDFRGRLPDIRPDVWRSRVSIVPLRYGSGTRIKIIESMALGTPIVSTSKGAEGLQVTPEANILIADTPIEFAQQAVRLLKDQDLWQRLSVNGRKLVEEKYDWLKVGPKLDDVIHTVVEKRPAKWH